MFADLVVMNDCALVLTQTHRTICVTGFRYLKPLHRPKVFGAGAGQTSGMMKRMIVPLRALLFGIIRVDVFHLGVRDMTTITVSRTSPVIQGPARKDPRFR